MNANFRFKDDSNVGRERRDVRIRVQGMGLKLGQRARDLAIAIAEPKQTAPRQRRHTVPDRVRA